MPCLVRDYNKMLDEQAMNGTPRSPAGGIVNPQMLQDPVGEQQKAMDHAVESGVGEPGAAGMGDYRAAAGVPQGAIFATNLQPNYPYPPNVGPYGPPPSEYNDNAYFFQ